MAIDVGPGAGDYSAASGPRTFICGANPANDTGTIDYVQTWFSGSGAGFEAAAFDDEGSNAFSTNGAASMGAISDGENEWNAPGDFTAFAITTGEYIGAYWSDGSAERREGDGGWFLYSDEIPASSVTFTVSATREIALYATGVEAGGGETFYQNAGQGAVASIGVLSKKTSKYPGGHAMNIAGIISKKTSKFTGGYSVSIAGILNKKTTPVTAMGGHSTSIAGVLTNAVVLAQNTGGHVMTIAGTLTTVVTFVRAIGGHAMTIVGTLVKKTSKSVGGGQLTPTGILSKKTSKDVGGGSVTSIGTLTTAIMYMQAVGGASMSIVGSLATQFIAGVEGVAKFIRRRKTFYKQ